MRRIWRIGRDSRVDQSRGFALGVRRVVGWKRPVGWAGAGRTAVQGS